jgi:NAD(P)-dependent dehydrogenase (short-subunit alcohol dehydrogenase family)
MNAAAMTGYGRVCGWTLARALARTGDRIAIAAYLGGSDKFDQAVADFAESYADQTDRDHTALADAVASGRAQARVGVSAPPGLVRYLTCVQRSGSGGPVIGHDHAGADRAPRPTTAASSR